MSNIEKLKIMKVDLEMIQLDIYNHDKLTDNLAEEIDKALRHVGRAITELEKS